jgi:1,4-alpha-glucan branching enzyme
VVVLSLSLSPNYNSERVYFFCQPGQYRVVLNSDDKQFGGHGRVDNNGRYFTTDLPWNNRANFLQVSLTHHYYYIF